MFAIRRSTSVGRWVLVFVAVLASSGLIVSGSPWTTRIVSGPRILLNYPSLIEPETARLLLEDRESALAFAEEALCGRLFRRLIVTLEPTLLMSAGLSEPTEGGGAITFYVPACALERFERDGTSPFGFFGCHEEVHAVANHLWQGNDFGTLAALGEGVAVYVEELHRGTGLRHSIARALQASGSLYDVDRLLGDDWSEDPVGLIQLNVYYGGASFVEFLLEAYGMEKLAELYGVKWIEWDIRNLDDDPMEADPAEEILRIYGKTAAEMDTEWQAWVASHATTSAADADLFLRAFTSDITCLDASIPELEEYWRTSPFRLVGPSPLIAILYEEINEALYSLADLHGVTLTEAYDAFLQALDCFEDLLAAWLDAVHALEEAVALIATGGTPERVVGLLEAAEAGYEAVNDAHMLRRVREVLTECRPDEGADSPD